MIFYIFFLLCSIVFLYISRKIKINAKSNKKKYRIPKGKITYSDLSLPAKPFFSKKYNITGKPDYIVFENNNYIPIEFKSGSCDSPRQNHILQLATYCQLLEDFYNGFVTYGRLVYNNSDFIIPFDPKLRFELDSVISEMKKSIKYGDVKLNHNDFGKCKKCSMRKYCTEKLI